MQAAIATAKADGTLWAGSLSAAWWVCLPVWGTHAGRNGKPHCPAGPSPFPRSRAWNLAPGFGVAALRGSQNNDPFYMDGGQVKTRTNHAGGILGGITNGMPLVFRVAVKPTPSIAQPQDSVSLSRGENTTLEIHGRHDPCIVPRAVPLCGGGGGHRRL